MRPGTDDITDLEIAGEGGETIPDANEFIDWLDQPVVSRNYVLSLFPFSLAPFSDDGEEISASEIAQHEIAGSIVTVLPVGVEEFHFSTSGYTSFATDSPANTHMESRVAAAETDKSFISSSSFGGLLAISGGASLLNADGALDGFFSNYAFDGRLARLRGGDPEAALASYGEILNGTIFSFDGSVDDIRLNISDGRVNLDVPIQQTTYSGTGGLNGGEDLKGKHKPVAYGFVRNISAPLVDSATLRYQVSVGPIQGVTAAYDRGISLTQVGSSPAAGQYSADTATGIVTLGATPAGTVTFDVEGKTPFVSTAAAIIQRILNDILLLTTDKIETSTFTTFGLYESGLWTDIEPMTVSDGISRLLSGFNGFAGFNRFGRFAIGAVLAPGTTEAAVNITQQNITTVDRLAMPDALNPIVWRVSVGYARNYTVQNDFAAAVPGGRRTFAAEQLRFATAEDSGAKSRHLLSREIVLSSEIRTEADASIEALRLLALFSRPLAVYRIATRLSALATDIGEEAHITFPRYGFALGRQGIIVGSRFSIGGGSELMVLA